MSNPGGDLLTENTDEIVQKRNGEHKKDPFAFLYNRWKPTFQLSDFPFDSESPTVDFDPNYQPPLQSLENTLIFPPILGIPCLVPCEQPCILEVDSYYEYPGSKKIDPMNLDANSNLMLKQQYVFLATVREIEFRHVVVHLEVEDSQQSRCVVQLDNRNGSWDGFLKAVSTGLTIVISGFGLYVERDILLGEWMLKLNERVGTVRLLCSSIGSLREASKMRLGLPWKKFERLGFCPSCDQQITQFTEMKKCGKCTRRWFVCDGMPENNSTCTAKTSNMKGFCYYCLAVQEVEFFDRDWSSKDGRGFPRANPKSKADSISIPMTLQ